MPAKTSTICSIHFNQNDIFITAKGYRYLNSTAVPTQNTVTVINQTIQTNADTEMSLPGPSKKWDLCMIDDDDTFIANEKPRMDEREHSQTAESSSKILTKRVTEECMHLIPQNKEHVNCLSRKLTKWDSNVLLEADSGIHKKKHEEDGVQSPFKKRHTSSKKSRLAPIIVLGSTYTSLRIQKLSAMLRWTQNKVKNEKLKIKRLQTQGRRFKRKLVNVDQILKELKDKFAMTNENLASLQHLNVQVQDLTGRQIGNVDAALVSKKHYSPALRSFALTLNYYSPKAYAYMHRIFDTSLPHPKVLKKWYSKIGGDPGFTKEAFAALKRKADSSISPIVATLVLDEMRIRKRIECDGQKLYGYVDMGTGLEGDHLAEAKEALVFLITAINSNFKVPVGFFLVDGVTGNQRTQLVKICLQMAHSAGIKVVALTFDGSAANISMAGHLGCSIQDLKNKFNHPVTHDPVVAVLDPCHMMKLIKTSFDNYQTFVDVKENKIEFKYLQQLNNLPCSEAFHFTNKFKDHHINFKNERMKVKLATQLFSDSVVKAIQYCREDLKMESFAFSGPTEKFLMIFNKLFDIFNSKNLYQHGFKKALHKNNANSVFEFLSMAFQYISSLKLTDGTLAIKSLWKTGFLGLLNCIQALKHLYGSLIESNILIYLPFYKFSQNHLELFFCNIRYHGGSNNNPTARQFISAYKTILLHLQLKDNNKGNSSPLEQFSILNCLSAEERINRTSGLNITHDDSKVRENETSYYNGDFKVSDFSFRAIVHIAGYIVKKMIKSINCNICVDALITSKDPNLYRLIIAKDNDGLQYPSKDVVRICQVSEKFIKMSEGGNIKKEVLTTQILRQFVESNIFDSIATHQLGDFPTSNHVTDLIKAVIVRYLNIRIPTSFPYLKTS